MITENKLTILVDIDGTIADTKHREHFLNIFEGGQKDWNGFFSAMVDDTPIPSVIDWVKGYIDRGWNVFFVTGRPEAFRKVTEDWLDAQGLISLRLIMKPKPDQYIKAALWKAKVVGMLQDEGWNILLAIDDDPSVREMYQMFCIECVNPEGIING